jgi:hypothetical protein
MSLIASANPLIISSASSKMISLIWSVESHFRSIICFNLPGVPMAMLASPFCKAFLSSLASVPPMNDLTLTGKNWLIPTATL